MATWLLALAAALGGALGGALWMRAATAARVERQRGEAERTIAAERATAAAREEGMQRELRELRDARIPSLEALLRERDAQVESLREAAHAANLETTTLRERLDREREAAEKQLALLEQAKSTLADAFKALSSDALSRNNQTFLDLAKQVLAQHQERAKGDLDARSQQIDSLVKPLKESLEKVDTRIGELEKVRASAYGSLNEQLRTLQNAQLQLQSETSRLVQALRSPGVGGRWGEIQLRRVVELAGMVAYCDFGEQETVTNDERRLRPDMVVRLPNERTIVVDAKAPLQAYMQAHEAHDESSRNQFLEQHAAQIRGHVRQLASRGYWERFNGSAEFVVLFLPGDAFYSAAVERDPALMESIVEQRVLIATPMTLIALLKAVAYGWRQDAVTRDAQEISRLGRDLYERMRTLALHFADLRRNLDRSVDSYNRAVGSMERMVLPAARRFRDLGAASGDEIPELEPIDHAARASQAPELLAIPAARPRARSDDARLAEEPELPLE
jgi:DNA recombination protein RmuC